MRKKSTLDPKRPIRLSIVTQFYPPDYAATGQLIEELAGHLAEQGLQVQIFTGQPGYAFQKCSAPAMEQFPGLTVQRSRSSGLWPERIRGKALNGLLFCLRSALHLIKNFHKKDLLLLTTAPPYLPILGLLVNRLFNAPYICLLYDLYPDVAIELQVVSAKNLLTRFWNLLNRWAWRHAERIIVLSASMKDQITKKCPEAADKISIIHSWANPDWIVPIAKQNNWFAKQYQCQDKFTILYSGNMGRCHDMDTILDAVKDLATEPVQFVFIGGGAKRQAFIEQVNYLGLENCLFLPYQDKQTLPYSLTACDLSLVSLSPGMEGLIAPSKFYGSLAAGRPVAVICEPHSYLRKIVQAADCGQAFDSGDYQGLSGFIRYLTQNEKLAQQMGRSGRRYLETHFTPEIVAQQYLNVLQMTFQLRSTAKVRDRRVLAAAKPAVVKPVVPKKVTFAQRLINWHKSKLIP